MRNDRSMKTTRGSQTWRKERTTTPEKTWEGQVSTLTKKQAVNAKYRKMNKKKTKKKINKKNENETKNKNKNSTNGKNGEEEEEEERLNRSVDIGNHSKQPFNLVDLRHPRKQNRIKLKLAWFCRKKCFPKLLFLKGFSSHTNNYWYFQTASNYTFSDFYYVF